jgi:transposase-like protein
MAILPASWLRRRVALRRCRVEDDREGQFHTQVFERYRSSEPQVAQGLTDMFVAGTSTPHLWAKSPRRCWE